MGGTLGTFAGWGLTQVWVAAHTGILDWDMKRGPIHIEQATRPELFWVFTIAFCLGFLWLLYVCCAEIVYAMLWYKPQ